MNKEETERTFEKVLRFELGEETSNKIERVALYMLESGVMLYTYCGKHPLTEYEQSRIADIASTLLGLELLEVMGEAEDEGYVRFAFDYLNDTCYNE